MTALSPEGVCGYVFGDDGECGCGFVLGMLLSLSFVGGVYRYGLHTIMYAMLLLLSDNTITGRCVWVCVRG